MRTAAPFLTLLAFLLLGPISVLAIASGYLQSCNRFQFDQYAARRGYAIMQAFCQPRDQSRPKRYTTLDLNRCIVNSGGRLLPQDNGGFLGSCKNCGPGSLGDYLVCNCYAVDGFLAFTELYLNPFIGNNDGHLQCYGHLGS